MVPVDGVERARSLALALLLVLPALASLPVAADGHVGLQGYESIRGSDDSFGSAVAWHGDTLIVGASGDGVVRVLELRDGLWRVVQTLEGATERYDRFGAAVAVHGDLLAVGAPQESTSDGNGAAYVYRNSGNGWVLVERVTGDGRSYDFGLSVALHGEWLAVGAPDLAIGGSSLTYQSAVHMFKVGATVQHVQKLQDDSLVQQRWFGHDLDLHGSRLLVGAPGSIGEERIDDGAAFVYVRSGNTWTREATFQRENALDESGGFGGAVALSEDEAVVCNDHSIYVAYDTRTLHVYKRSGGTWSLSQTLHEVSCHQSELDRDRLVTIGSFSPYLRVYGPSGTRWSQQEVDFGSVRPDAVALGPAIALGDPSTRSGTVYLVGHNTAPEAVATTGEPPWDIDGDGFETVTLDGTDSTGGDGDPVHHAWYDAEGALLGRGATLEVKLSVGKHPVRLAVWDDHLGTDVAGLDVEVLPPPPPAVDFSWLPDTGTVDETFRFIDESTSEYGHVVAWSWDFDGDGGDDATGPAPSWDFERSGAHDVRLTVRTDIGTEASATQRVTVRNLAPEARAGMDQILHDEDGDGGETVELDGSDSDDRDGEVRRYEWVRDGRRIGSSETLSVRLARGVHDIDLTVTDDRGAKDKDRVTILVLDRKGNTTGGGAPPDAAFSWKPAAGPPNHAAAFEDASSDRDGRVVMWWYDVGADGSYEATEPDPVLGMGGYGARDVQLVVTDDDGQQSKATQNVFLKNGAPTAIPEARATEAFVGQIVVFLDNSTDPEDALQQRAWDFGDGSTSTEQAPAHVYDEPGTYTVKLTVTDDGGRTDEATLDVVVREVPPGVEVPAVAGSPFVAQADDSPFADEEPLVDTDGDGTPDAPAGSDDAGAGPGGSDGRSGDRNVPVAALDPGRPWLWLALMAACAVLVVVLGVVVLRR